jgi:zinc/manganese transport system permease protein
VPAGPAVIIAAGVFYLASLAFGAEGGLARRLLPARHLEA